MIHLRVYRNSANANERDPPSIYLYRTLANLDAYRRYSLALGIFLFAFVDKLSHAKDLFFLERS